MERTLIQKIEVLSGARQLISKPENWIQYMLWNNAGAYCARGAMITAGNRNGEGWNDEDVCNELGNDLSGHPNLTCRIVDYNNSHSHSEVLAAFDTTIKRLKRQLVIEQLKEAKTILENAPFKEFEQVQILSAEYNGGK